MRLPTKHDCRILLRLSVFAFCFFFLGGERLFSQADTGSIVGTVTDASGAAIPGAKVTIVNVATNQQRTFATDTDGGYSSGPLRPGEYTVEAERTGFKRVIRTNIVLNIQQAAVVNVTMQVGAVRQEVTVTAAVPLVQTTDAAQGSVIGELRVRGLPLNGRDYLQLSLLSEGTLPPPGRGRTAVGVNGGGGSRAGGFSAAGQRTTDNNYLLDGFDNNTVDTGFDNNQAGVIKPSVDAIQEFKVQTSSYPAQFGNAGGGVVNLILKSGTNQFHGDAYDFIRNEKMDARNFFNPGKVPSFKRNDYGLTVGGPVVKNKAFFFFSWEQLKLRESTINNNTIPTAAMRQGEFSALNAPIYNPLTYDPTTGTRQVFPGNIIPPSQFDPVAQQFINLYPTPQNSGLSSNFIHISPNDENLNRFNTRVDYQASEKDQLSYMYNRETYIYPGSDVWSLPPPAFGGNSRVANMWANGTGITWNHIFSPTLLTSTRLGWFEEKYLLGFPSEALALGNVAAKFGLQVPASHQGVTYPNFSPSGYSSLGPGNFTPYLSQGENRQIKNDTTWVKGAHTIQFGAEAVWIQTNNVNTRNEEGTFNFSGRYTRDPVTDAGGNSIADFLLGYVDNSAYSTTTRVTARATSLAGYLQDLWKINKRFTLNWGLRYEYLIPYHDKYRKIANVDLDTNPLQPTIILESQNPYGFTSNSPFNFQPRVGIVYQLLPGKVVVRTGYGIYSPFQRFSPWGDSASWLVNPPYNVAVTTSSDGITPSSLLRNGIPDDQVSLQHATSVALASQQRHPAHEYVQQWNMNVQYQFARNWLFQVGYFGSKGTHLVNALDTNYVTSLGPGNINNRRRFKSIFIPTSIPGMAGPVSGVTISPLGAITRTEYTGNTNFNSLQVKVQHRFSGGFTILGAWTWAKALGDTADNNPEGSSPGYGYQNPADIHNAYSPLDIQLAQSFVFSGIWDLPYGHGRRFGSNGAPWANAILGGWSLGSILTLTSGRPFTITVNGDPANSGQTNRADLVGNPYAVPGGQSVAEFFNTAAFAPNQPYTYGNLGRNSMTGPRFADLDVSLMKTVSLFPSKDHPVKLQIRGDAFNVLNHTNFEFPGSTLGTPTFGEITAANDPRLMQVALKLIF